MRIAINCRSILLSQRTGIGRYTYHLLENLGKIDQTNAYILHAPKRLLDFLRKIPDFSKYKNFKNVIDCFNRGAGLSDIYHLPSPDEIGPTCGKLIVTIHDLIHKTYPQSHQAQTIALTGKYMERIAAKADMIICISENTRRDLHSFLKVPLERSCVVHNGVDHELFYPLSPPERLAAAEELRDLGIVKPYVLFVGTIEPRKNLDGLLETFAQLKSRKIFDGHLVVAGMTGWMVEGIQDLVKKLNIQADVIFTGYVSDARLRQLYGGAEIFVFPSFYEGFGFPILEAFCCGTAVITSQSSSCAEIAGQAAILVDPSNSTAMASAMEKVLSNAAVKASLRQAGLKRAQEFSFEKMAQETLAVYQRVAH